MKVGIGLSGKAGSGKSTVAKEILRLLPKEYSAVRLSFAEKLKAICDEIFPHLLVGDKEDHRWVYKDTGLAMRSVDMDCWVKYVLRQINKWDIVLVDDVRFQNEAELLRANGFIIVRVERDKHLREQMGYDTRDTHISEVALDDYNFDYWFRNNGEYPFTSVAEVLVRRIMLELSKA